MAFVPRLEKNRINLMYLRRPGRIMSRRRRHLVPVGKLYDLVGPTDV